MVPNDAAGAGSVQVAAVIGMGEGRSYLKSNHKPVKHAKQRGSIERFV